MAIDTGNLRSLVQELREEAYTLGVMSERGAHRMSDETNERRWEARENTNRIQGLIVRELLRMEGI